MKRFLSLLALTILVVASCSKYDDTELQRRVSALEAYQSLLQKLDSGKPVTSYSQSGTDVTFNFGDGSSITIDNKPSAENPIKTITADGSTLTITLADGTVIPVAYGEKEGYTFTLGDGQRKCYSFWESKESFRTGILKIPYTLTGELTSVDDVKIIASVDNFATEFVQTKETVTVEPIDAKSGNIVLKRLHQIPRADSDDAFEALFPGFYLDLVAYFPDGSAKTAGTIKVLTEKLRLTEGFEVMDYSNLWEIPEMRDHSM